MDHKIVGQQTLDPNVFKNVLILIGISPNKCGSSFINHCLSAPLRQLNYKYIGKRELGYWDQCIYAHLTGDKGCNFTEYVEKWMDVDSIQPSFDEQLILFEKTPRYIRYYHSAYLLSYYAHIYNIYFYVSFRNPTHRLWSQCWMHRRHIYDKNDQKSIQEMVNQINNEIDTFSNRYPKYQKVLSFIQISQPNETYEHNVIDEAKLVQLWIDASYDLYNNIYWNIDSKQDFIENLWSHKINPVQMLGLIVGCYYPQLLMWYHTFKSFNNKNGMAAFNVSDRFKIVQSEYIFNNGLTMFFKQLLLWIDGYKNKTNQIEKYFDQHLDNTYFENAVPLSHNGLRSSFVPQNIKIDEIALGQKLDNFYQDCNVRLYWFLQRHPELLLIKDIDHEFHF